PASTWVASMTRIPSKGCIVFSCANATSISVQRSTGSSPLALNKAAVEGGTKASIKAFAAAGLLGGVPVPPAHTVQRLSSPGSGPELWPAFTGTHSGICCPRHVRSSAGNQFSDAPARTELDFVAHRLGDAEPIEQSLEIHTACAFLRPHE